MDLPTTQELQPRNLVIVDPAFDDYSCHTESVDGRQVTLTDSAAGALRLAPSNCDAHWFVNCTLPDMTGSRLLEMLHAIEPTIAIQLIGDHYEVQQELDSHQLGAVAYRAKPLDRFGFDDW